MTRDFPDNLVLDANAIAAMTGLELMQAIVAGTMPQAPIAVAMNFRLVAVEEGQSVFEGVPGPEFRNPLGTIHGGWYGAILDSALAVAVHSRLGKGAASTTLEYKINITRAIPPGMLVRATGTASHVGRTTAVSEAKLTGVEDGRLYATGSTTCIILNAS
ncbi:MAG: PaaI family thioesterase [Rhodobacteraceae bacterium]|nr:PaaI family thioesterase [Paracoccaceae bacterium]